MLVLFGLHYTTKFEHFSNTNPNSLARSQTRGLAAADGGPEPCPHFFVFNSRGGLLGIVWSGRARVLDFQEFNHYVRLDYYVFMY